jgi:2-(1,2-epoxy-1,2-dihydrophenyl)acetyl-CoA isomerase
MDYQFIHFSINQGVATIALNRPEVLNSFNEKMAKETQNALDLCAEYDEIRAVVITGTGRGFCAGQDLQEVLTTEENPNPKSISNIVLEHYNPIVLKIRELEKPVIAAVNGVAAGAGANLALVCDFVFAEDQVSFVQAFSKIGLVPDTGGTWILPRLVGLAQATRMMFLGEKVTASEAKELGMIYQVTELGKSVENAVQFAQFLATQPTRAYGLTKRLLNQSFESNLLTQLQLEAANQQIAGETSDHREGVAAFLQKRKPLYTGK